MRKDLFIYRPILAIAISLIICLCGLIAIFNIAVSQFPEVSPPSVQVKASFPGANAETAAKVVAAQIENQLNGVNNLMYMATNTTSTGGINIRLTYELGTNLNIAINEVLNRLYAAKRMLPAIVQKMGINARKSSPDTLLNIVFYSDPYLKPVWVSSYLQRTIQNDLFLLPTVGDVSVRGAGKYVLTAWLDPNKMYRYNIDVRQIEIAIGEQNLEYPMGRTNSTPNSSNKQSSLNIIGPQMYASVEDLGNTIIKNNGNQTIRLKDMARIELNSNDYSAIAHANFIDEQGKFKSYPITTMQIQLTPGANQLLAKQQIQDLLAKESLHFPTGLKYRILQDNSRFVAASIHNVIETILIAFFLVTAIILLFLKSLRTCFIAACVVPVSILGTIACLYVLNFSLNTLSLFAMILSIGIVVDDAIIILENIERIRRDNPNISILDATTQTINEVFSAIIAITIVLTMVFIPTMMLSGLSGVMYRQFAVTITCSVIISAICSLSLTPALCSLIIKPHHKPHLKLLIIFDNAFESIKKSYLRMVERIILLRKLVIFFWLSIIIATITAFKIIPLGFVQSEDQGLVFATINMPASYSLSQTESVVHDYVAVLSKNKNINAIVTTTGIDQSDSGSQKSSASSLIISLRDWSDRPDSQMDSDALILQMNKLAKNHIGMNVFAYSQPPIRGLNTSNGVEFYLKDNTIGDPVKLEETARNFATQLQKHTQITKVRQSLDTSSLQVTFTPNVERALFYGVSLKDYYQVLKTIYSNNNINFAYILQDLTWVIIEADYPYRASVNNLNNVFLHSTTCAKMVPMGSLTDITYNHAPQTIQRFNNALATKITVSSRKDVAIGDVMDIIQKEGKLLPTGYSYDWFGTSYQINQTKQIAAQAVTFALIMIYLVLAALYESWKLPLVVLAGVPCALFGSAVMLLITGGQNDLYFQISLIALLGLSAKNIILLVEVALKLMEDGHSSRYSAMKALDIRFRPIVMTSIAFICGTFPLTIARGAGANAQHSIGIGIIGGCIGSLVIATLITPVFFAMLAKKHSSVD